MIPQSVLCPWGHWYHYDNIVLTNPVYAAYGIYHASASKMLGKYHIAPPEEHCHNSKNTNFQERGKNHWAGWCNRIKTTTLLPSRGHFSKQTCDAIPLGRCGLRHTSCGHNSKWASFSCDTVLLGERYVHCLSYLTCLIFQITKFMTIKIRFRSTCLSTNHLTARISTYVLPLC
jgi:hypothetical protein